MKMAIEDESKAIQLNKDNQKLNQKDKKKDNI